MSISHFLSDSTHHAIAPRQSCGKCLSMEILNKNPPLFEFVQLWTSDEPVLDNENDSEEQQ